MTRATLLHVLERPTDLGPDEVRELERLAQAFPYCQTAHLLLAKAAHDQGTMLAGQRLRRAATYAADRTLLRRLIEQDKPPRQAEAQPMLPHLLVDREAEFAPAAAAAPVVPPAPNPPAPTPLPLAVPATGGSPARPAEAAQSVEPAASPVVSASPESSSDSGQAAPAIQQPAAAAAALTGATVLPVQAAPPVLAPPPDQTADLPNAGAPNAAPALSLVAAAPAAVSDLPDAPAAFPATPDLVAEAATGPVAVIASVAPAAAPIVVEASSAVDSGPVQETSAASAVLAPVLGQLAVETLAQDTIVVAVVGPWAGTAAVPPDTASEAELPSQTAVQMDEVEAVAAVRVAKLTSPDGSGTDEATAAMETPVTAAPPETIAPAAGASVAVDATAPNAASGTEALETAEAAEAVEPADAREEGKTAELAVGDDATGDEVAAFSQPLTTGCEEPDLPAQAPAIRPPAEVGAARFEYGLADPAPQPAAPRYELPGLVDEWASAAVTMSLGGPILPTPAAALEPVFTPAAFTGDATVGYALGASSRLGLALQLLDLLTAKAEAAEAATAVVAAAQPAATALPPTGTFFEPDPLLLGHWATYRPVAPEVPSTLDLINNFLKRQPRLTRPAMLPPTPAPQADLSMRSTRAEPDLVSENLARIFVRQGKTARAIEIYEKLMVKQPEKMAYFAAQIAVIQDKSGL